jgi:hypothetical protein
MSAWKDMTDPFPTVADSRRAAMLDFTPAEKRPVVIVTRPDTHDGMSCTCWLKDFDIDAEFDSAEVGERITLEYGEMSFVPDASLPSAFYYQSTIFPFDSFDPAVQRINLLEPQGTSRLQFNVCPDDPNSQLAPFLSRNGSVIETRVPPMPNGTRLVGVVFSPNGAEEDYVGPLNYTYHNELELHAVSPAGSPIDGGTELLVTGAFLDQVADVLTDDRVRCLFDASDSVAAPDGPLVLPQASPITFRNTTHLICRSPPSWLGRPPYLMHGAPLRKEVRTVEPMVSHPGSSPSFGTFNPCTSSSVTQIDAPSKSCFS